VYFSENKDLCFAKYLPSNVHKQTNIEATGIPLWLKREGRLVQFLEKHVDAARRDDPTFIPIK
jgi:predicted GNAT family acetyltransferase